MNKLSFGLATPHDLLDKLLYDYGQHQQDPTNPFIALNCAMTAWHFTDWIFWHINPDGNKKQLEAFQTDMKEQCLSLGIMHDISNGTKHSKLLYHKPSTKTELHRGAFSRDFSRDFDITCLRIELGNGTILYFEDEIKKAVDFWTDYLKKSHACNTPSSLQSESQ